MTVPPPVSKGLKKSKKLKQKLRKPKKIPAEEEEVRTVVDEKREEQESHKLDSQDENIRNLGPPKILASLANEAQPSENLGIESTSFEKLGVCEELCIACDSLGWKTATPIQKEVLPVVFKGNDIIALAETGSGKTGAFALPILQNLLANPQKMFALVLAPTRELCVQIAQCFAALGASIGLEIVTILGGLDMVSQALALAKRPHIIVASPGRLCDHLENTKGFTLRTVRYLVLDEADRLLSMDFEEPLEKIIRSLPKTRRTLLFSATMTARVSKLQRASLTSPVRVEVNNRFDTVANLNQSYLFIPFKFKHTYIAALLDHYKKYGTIIFSNTCVATRRLAVFARHLGFSSVCLHGKMTQPQRLGALKQFRAGEKRVLVATEVGSRGLDIPLVDLVINFDTPMNSKDYIHRVGRTARAGRSGRAITVVTQYDIEQFQKIEFSLGNKLPEFHQFGEEEALKFHDRAAEALRTADLEVKETDESVSLKKRSKKQRKFY